MHSENGWAWASREKFPVDSHWNIYIYLKVLSQHFLLCLNREREREREKANKKCVCQCVYGIVIWKICDLLMSRNREKSAHINLYLNIHIRLFSSLDRVYAHLCVYEFVCVRFGIYFSIREKKSIQQHINSSSSSSSSPPPPSSSLPIHNGMKKKYTYGQNILRCEENALRKGKKTSNSQQKVSNSSSSNINKHKLKWEKNVVQTCK